MVAKPFKILEYWLHFSPSCFLIFAPNKHLLSTIVWRVYISPWTIYLGERNNVKPFHRHRMKSQYLTITFIICPLQRTFDLLHPTPCPPLCPYLLTSFCFRPARTLTCGLSFALTLASCQRDFPQRFSSSMLPFGVSVKFISQKPFLGRTEVAPHVNSYAL